MDKNLLIFVHFLLILFVWSEISATKCFKYEAPTPLLNRSFTDFNKLIVENETYIEIKSGFNLHLICEGSDTIIWHSTDFKLYSIEAKEYVEIRESFVDNKNISELIVSEITSTEIGFYSCHYSRNFDVDNFDVDMHHTKHNSIYVFVNDKEHLFEYKVEYPSIAVNNSEARGLCRPTSSLSKVSLWLPSNDTTVYTEMSVGPQNGIQFDPKYGFTVKRLQKHYLKCKAILENKTQEFKKNFTFLDGLEFDPFITDLNKTFLFSGDNFTLDCLIRYSQTHQPHLYWNYEDHCLQEQQNRLLRPNSSLTVLGQFEYISLKLTIINAQLKDSGLYICTAYGADYDHRTVTKMIEVYELPKLELKSNHKNNLSLDFNQEFVFNISIDSVPNVVRAVTLNWTKNGIPLTHRQNARLSIIKEGSEYAVLMINDTNCDDSGLYRVEANLLDILFANISVNLLVKKCEGFKFHESVQMSDESDFIVMIVIFAIFGSILLFMALFIGQKIREARCQKREFEILSYSLFENGQLDMINPDLPLDEQIDLLPYDKRCEFPRDNLVFGQILGQGAFGRVVRAEAFGIKSYSQSCTTLNCESTTVAVKMLKERADIHQRKALLAELKILIHVGKHINIVNLLGAVTKDLIKGELLVIVEYCKFGNIRSFLLDHRNKFINQLNESIDEINANIGENEPKYYNINENITNDYQNVVSITEISELRDRKVTTCDLINYVYQCAKGMEYLSSKKLIHRDLAARNVLLAEDHIVKICDFGLARECYNYDNYIKKGEGPLPIKWMAIESMRDKIYTEKSDVWSFGVLMWEIFTLGSNPYPGFELDEQFYMKLVDGYRMERPQFASNTIYSLMKNCWESDPNDRPDFTSLSSQLKAFMNETHLKKYENNWENYNKTIDSKQPIDDYLKMNAKQNQNQNQFAENESYVDMTVDSHGNEQVVYRAIKRDENEGYPYDEVKNVRSIFANTPVPDEPMEVVPMIQL